MGEIMMWVSRYWACGLLVLFVLDVLNYAISKSTTDEEHTRFTNGERVAIFLFWPIMVVTFFGAWFYSWIKRILNK